MELNAEKFELLCDRVNPDPHPCSYKSNTGTIIHEKGHLKDLGITMSADASFRQHIQSTIVAAQNQCSWILRTFRTRDATPMLTLWRSLVQCKLDYCSQLWSPSKKGEIQAIEMVQRSFLRKIPSLKPLSYWDQLKKLGLYSQERRRERYSIIYVWKMLENLVPNIPDELGNAKVKCKWHPRRGRECIIPSVLQTAKRRVQTLRYASLPIRGQQLFNALPSVIRNLTDCSVDTFKHHLDRYLVRIPDEPLIQGYTASRRSESNSLLDMSKFAPAHPISREEATGVIARPDSRGCLHSVAGAP